MNWITGTVIAIIVAVVIFAIANTTQYRYWITAGDTTYYTNEFTEKDGCIEFTDWTNWHVRQCGFYSVQDRGQAK